MLECFNRVARPAAVAGALFWSPAITGFATNRGGAASPARLRRGRINEKR